MPVIKTGKGGYKVKGAKTPKKKMTRRAAEKQHRAIKASQAKRKKPKG